MRTYIVCSADRKPGWETPRHLLVLPDGEVLLHRTVRQFLAYGPVTVLGPDLRYKVPGAALHIIAEPPPEWRYNTDALLQLDPFDKQDGIVMAFGDTYFSDEAVKTIMQSNMGIAFFGRWGRSKVTDTTWGELFAVLVSSPARWTFLAAWANWIVDQYRKGAIWREGLWELLCDMEGLKPIDKQSSHPMPKRYYVEINDATDDIDFVKDVPGHLKGWKGK